MNGQEPIPTGIEPIQPPVSVPVQEKPKFEVPLKVREIWNKFYSNKKIFWPVTIAAGLFLLVLIAGLLFGTRNGTIKPTKPTPTPQVTVAPEEAESTDPLSVINSKLIKLGVRINQLDVHQSRLAPPSIDFNIRF